MDKEDLVPIAKGNLNDLPRRVKIFVSQWVQKMGPKALYICDGSQVEAEDITQKMIESGALTKLKKYDNCYLCRADRADVARDDAKTFISTEQKFDAVPHVREEVKGILGQWKSTDEMIGIINENMNGCMAGRTMYVIPFSMGPVGGPLSKIGVQLTDSNYVLLCMRIMTRVSPVIWKVIGDQDFVRCVHSVGCPKPVQRKIVNHWPCNPEKLFVSHFPKKREIVSYGSGYGENSLLGNKCFGLRIASVIARDEGWLAEHMLIIGLANEISGEEKFVAAAFPSNCGRTSLAMITPSVPGYKVRCVGNGIAWMRFNDKGELRAINPENGFFGVAPGTNTKTNPNVMKSFQKNSIFTNVAETADGGFYWEGMEDEIDENVSIIDWLGQPYKIGSGTMAAHPNARFTCPASQCPVIHPTWEDPEGVPISAIIFGGRRPYGVPLVFETFSWEHGVAVGACVKTEDTFEEEVNGKMIMHDPMAMRPFIGYNFGHYLQHWLNMKKTGRKMPKIFHVNWFRVDRNGEFLWPGYRENIRVLDWIFKRCNGDDVESIAVRSPIGYIPKKGAMNVQGIINLKWDELFRLPKHFWQEDIRESKRFLEDQVGCDVPQVVWDELNAQEKRIDEEL